MSTPLVSLLSTLITMGVLVLFGVLAPSLSRPTVPLGVSVPSDRIDDPRVRSSIRRYRALAAATGVVAFAGSLATSSAPAAVIGWSTGYLVALWLVWIVARRPITEAKSAEDWYAGHDVRIWGSVSDAKPRVGVRWRWSGPPARDAPPSSGPWPPSWPAAATRVRCAWSDRAT